MTVVAHRAGSWLGIASADAWILVDLPESDGRVAALHAAIAAADLSAALDGLTGAGVSATPPFAMASRVEGQVRYLVRGSAMVVLATGDSSQTVSGFASPTWTDAYAPSDVIEIRLVAPSSGVAGGAVSDVVRAGELTISLASEAEPAAPAEAPTVAAPLDADEADDTDDLAADQPASSYESVFFDLLTANTTTRDALAEKLTAAQTEEPPPAPQPPPAPPAPADKPASGETASWQSTWQPSSVVEPTPVPPVTPPTPPAAPPAEAPRHAAPPAAPPATPPTSQGGIIAALPWEMPSATPPAPPAPPEPPVSSSFPPPPSMPRPGSMPPPPAAYPPPPAPVPPPPGAPAGPPVYLPPPAATGSVNAAADPDNEVTRTRAQVLAQLAESEPSGPSVWAAVCPSRHWSPPYAPHCRVCGAPVADQQPQRIARPPLGRLHVSTGADVTLDRGVVFGRLPKTDAVGLERPHLMKLDSPEISRQHAEIRLSEWQVLVRDLGSGNGTTLTLPGRPTERLRPNEDYAVEQGSVIGIADLISVTYEVL